VWSGRHVVLGVSGGIACYKSCYLVRRLTEAGARVDVVLTPGAAEFVRPVTFEALSRRPVLTSLWEPGRALAHVRLGQEADLVIVAPATAHLIARMANGLADDLLTSMLLAATRPILLAPAMNDAMYTAPATRKNIVLLRERGIALVGPEAGPLAEGDSDQQGRMSEPETILHHAARLLGGGGALRGKRVVVTAGPTREALDPVRFITNASSGKMGFHLAQAAWHRGATVHLIAGPSGVAAPVGPELVRVQSTAELEQAVARVLPEADVLIMASAPADYRPKDRFTAKRPRSEGPLAIELEPTNDILTTTRGLRRPGSVMVGFALETGGAEAKARDKLVRKELDLIVVNDALEPGAGFEVDTNRVTVLDRDGGRWEIPLAGKDEVAERILDRVEARIGA
jgi:phosphopantothenoylcysteine decarboxylase / phosphopantothenate---cysteine ligase